MGHSMRRGATALTGILLVIVHIVQQVDGQDFLAIARAARAMAEAETAHASASSSADLNPEAGGGLSADQQQSKNHGNRKVSGVRAARGRIFDRTGKHFRSLTGLSSDQVRRTPTAASCLNVVLADVCRSIPSCDRTARYRTADGSCNNLDHPLWGASDTPQPRFLEPAYQNGEDSPRSLASDGSRLPSPRLISNFVHRALPQTKFESSLSLMVMQWGQFTDHDVVITPTAAGVKCCAGEPEPEDCFNINIPPGDPQFARSCMPLIRSLEAIPTDCIPGKRQQTNLLTSYIDGSNIYGSTQEEQDSLRTGKGGKLKTSEFDLLQKDISIMSCTKEAANDFCLRAGDERVSEQPVLSAVHTVFLREHNYIASRLSEINPQWDDERLFQETRKIVAAELQHITYTEYLTIILGQDITWYYGLWSRPQGYNYVYSPNIDASIVNVFAAASFRFGHSQIPEVVGKATQNFAHFGKRNLEDTFFKPNIYLSEPKGEGANGISRWVVSTPNLLTDGEIQRSVQDLLFLDADGKSLDLASLNLQRGRDHGLPSYNEYRVSCGLSRVVNWDTRRGGLVHHSAENAYKLRQAYRSPDDIDIFTGALTEWHVKGGLVGPTNACILGNQFRRLKLGDRFYYENPFPETGFTQDQLAEIKKIKLSKVLCRNMNMVFIQPEAFRAPGYRNPYVPCTTLPDINLEAWRERSPDSFSRLQSRSVRSPSSPLSVFRLGNDASFLVPNIQTPSRF